MKTAGARDSTHPRTSRRTGTSRWPLVLACGALLGAGAMFLAREAFVAAGREVLARERADAQRSGPGSGSSSALATDGAAPLAVPAHSTAPPVADANERVAVRESSGAAAAPPAGRDVLLELVERGRREGWLPDQQLAEMLFWHLVGQGRLEEAWDLAVLHAHEQQHLFLNLASHAHRAGAFALRDRALERALALGWVDPSFLAEIDPELALARYDRLIAEAEPGERLALQIGYAHLLISLGRNAEALSIAQARLATHPNDEAAIDVLCGLDLAAGEAHLRRLIETRDPQNDWTRKLIGLLGENGRPTEAAEWLENLQANGRPVYASDWGQLGDVFVAAGDTAGAVDAWLAALDLESGDPDAWTNPLLQHAPKKLLAALEARVSSGGHDEFWGALGDARWKNDQRSAAIQAWTHAAALDPSDGEWPSKLALAEAGKDPFGE